MSISAVSNQTSQSNQDNITTLKNSLKKVEKQISQLQKEGAEKNAKQIEILQKQKQQIEMQIQQLEQTQSQSSNNNQQNTSKNKGVGPAYTVELNQNNPSAAASQDAMAKTNQPSDISKE